MIELVEELLEVVIALEVVEVVEGDVDVVEVDVDVEVELGVVLVFVLRRRGASVIGLLRGERGVRRTDEGLVRFSWKLDGYRFRFEQPNDG